MNYWNNFWQSYRPIEIKSEDNMLYQVGLTVNGRPISSLIFNTIINDITEKLQLCKNDVVLDLCCGNGLITSKIAYKVKEITGIDFSETLLNTAKKYNIQENIIYINADLNETEASYNFLKNHSFNKVYMYQSLAYFNKEEFKNLLLLIKNITTKSSIIFIGSVLDVEKKWIFYNSFLRKLTYFINKLRKNDPGVGQWWSKLEIESIAAESGYSCQILKQKEVLHTSHYRFDILLKKSTELK